MQEKKNTMEYYIIIPWLNKNDILNGVSKEVPTHRKEEYSIHYCFSCIILLICKVIINVYDIVFIFKSLPLGNIIIDNTWNNTHHQYVWQLTYKTSRKLDVLNYSLFFVHKFEKCLTVSKPNCKLLMNLIIRFAIDFIKDIKDITCSLIKSIINEIIRFIFTNRIRNNNLTNNMSKCNINYSCNCLHIYSVNSLLVLLLFIMNNYANKRIQQHHEIQKWEQTDLPQMLEKSAINCQKSHICCRIYRCYLYKKVYSTSFAQDSNTIYIHPNYFKYNFCYIDIYGALYACVQVCCFKYYLHCFFRTYESYNNNKCINYQVNGPRANNDCQQIYYCYCNYYNEELNCNHDVTDYFYYYYFGSNSIGINNWDCSKYVNSSKFWSCFYYFYYLTNFITKTRITYYIFNGKETITVKFHRYLYVICISQDKVLKQIIKFYLNINGFSRLYKKYNTTFTSYISVYSCNKNIIILQLFNKFLCKYLQTYFYNIIHKANSIKYFEKNTPSSNHIHKNKHKQTFNIWNYVYIKPYVKIKFNKFTRSIKNNEKTQEIYCKHTLTIIANCQRQVKFKNSKRTSIRFKTFNKIFALKSNSAFMAETYTSANELNIKVLQHKTNATIPTLSRYKGSKTNLVWLLIGLVWLEEPKFITCNILINYQYLQHQQQLQPHHRQHYQEPQQQQNASNSITKTTTTKTTYCAHLDPFLLYHHLYQIDNNSYNINIYDIFTKNVELCKIIETAINAPSSRIVNGHRNNDDFTNSLQTFRNNTINIFAHTGLHFIINDDSPAQSDASRLESIKQQILLKLGFKRKPNISKRLPTDFIWETIYRADGFQGLNDINNKYPHLSYQGDHYRNHESNGYHPASIYHMNHLLQLFSTSNLDSKSHVDHKNVNTETKLASIKKGNQDNYLKNYNLNHLRKVIEPIYPPYSMGLKSKLYKIEVSKSHTVDKTQTLQQTLINKNMLSNIKHYGNNFKRNIGETYLTGSSFDDVKIGSKAYKFQNTNAKYTNFLSQKYNVKFKIDENDDFFGNTREIITFSEKGSLFKQHRLIEFASQNKEITNQKLIIRSAEIHVRIDKVLLPARNSNLIRQKILSNKNKRLKIWIFHLIQTNYTKKGNDQIARFCASFEVNPEMLGWQKIDLTRTVKEWITHQQTEKLHLLIDCTGCGKVYNLQLFENHSQMNYARIQNRNLKKIPTTRNIWMWPLSTAVTKHHNLTVERTTHIHNTTNRSKQVEKLSNNKFYTNTSNVDESMGADVVIYNETTKHYNVDLTTNNINLNPNRPFLVLYTEPKQPHRVQKRAINCNSITNGQCCKESFYVSFKALGWDDWIIAPRGYFANYCRGDCVHKFHTPDKFQSFHAHFIEEYRKMGLLNGMKPCCSPIKFSSMSLIYYGDEGIVKRDLPKMVVDECGCP